MTDSEHPLARRAADARLAGAGRDAHRLDRRRRRRRGGDGGDRERMPGDTHRHVRRRRLHRLPREAADDGAARRAQQRLAMVADQRVDRARPGRPRPGAAHRTGARHGVASILGRGRRPRGRARRDAHVRSRRVSVRGAAHPVTADLGEHAVAGRPRLGPVHAQLGRCPGRGDGVDRARDARPRHPVARDLGAGAALHHVDVVSGVECRPARRLARGRRHRHRRRADPPGGDDPAGTARQARRRQRRARADAGPARGALRLHRRSDRGGARSGRPSSCAPATSWRPSSSSILRDQD